MISADTDADEVIKILNLKEHNLEGGYYRETYRSLDVVSYEEILCSGRLSKLESTHSRTDKKVRPSSTLIYYLLKGHQISPLHKVSQDEVWHFYFGSSITLHIINEDSSIANVTLGNNISDSFLFHYVVKKNTWFCAEVDDKTSFSLLGCTVAPGFEFNDFELGTKSALLAAFPQHRLIIEQFVRHHG